jgi:hypothetical protein
VLCTGGGTPHKPPIMRGDYVYHESTACADYLIERVLSFPCDMSFCVICRCELLYWLIIYNFDIDTYIYFFFQ